MTHNIGKKVNGLATALGGITVLLLVASGRALAHGESSAGWTGHMWGGDWGSHMGGWMGLGGAWMWFLGLLWMLFLIALSVALVYLLLNQGRDRSDESDRALSLLREQYARGEISDDEFERRRNRLIRPDG